MAKRITRQAFLEDERDAEYRALFPPELIAWRSKVVKLFSIRAVMEGQYVEEELMYAPGHFHPCYGWKDPYLGIAVVAEKMPYSDQEQHLDSPYWEHEGKIF